MSTNSQGELRLSKKKKILVYVRLRHHANQYGDWFIVEAPGGETAEGGTLEAALLELQWHICGGTRGKHVILWD
jgi:hypothetical protein